jgi:hypothetical protein
MVENGLPHVVPFPIGTEQTKILLNPYNGQFLADKSVYLFLSNQSVLVTPVNLIPVVMDLH